MRTTGTKHGRGCHTRSWGTAVGHGGGHGFQIFKNARSLGGDATGVDKVVEKSTGHSTGVERHFLPK